MESDNSFQRRPLPSICHELYCLRLGQHLRSRPYGSKNIRCYQTYRWGFAFVQLNIMLIVCILWALGIIIMATRTCFTLQRTEIAADPQEKAVLELADALTVQLLRSG